MLAASRLHIRNYRADNQIIKSWTLGYKEIVERGVSVSSRRLKNSALKKRSMNLPRRTRGGNDAALCRS